jgi:hypothetical protein
MRMIDFVEMNGHCSFKGVLVAKRSLIGMA